MNVNLLGARDVQVAEIALQLVVGGLQVEERLRGERAEWGSGSRLGRWCLWGVYCDGPKQPVCDPATTPQLVIAWQHAG